MNIRTLIVAVLFLSFVGVANAQNNYYGQQANGPSIKSMAKSAVAAMFQDSRRSVMLDEDAHRQLYVAAGMQAIANNTTILHHALQKDAIAQQQGRGGSAPRLYDGAPAPGKCYMNGVYQDGVYRNFQGGGPNEYITDCSGVR